MRFVKRMRIRTCHGPVFISGLSCSFPSSWHLEIHLGRTKRKIATNHSTENSKCTAHSIQIFESSELRPMGSMKCRLLYLIGELHTGGSERQLCYLLRTMDRERYKPAVAVWNYSERDIHLPTVRALDVPLYSFPQNCSRVARLHALRRLVKQLQPEVV